MTLGSRKKEIQTDPSGDDEFLELWGNPNIEAVTIVITVKSTGIFQEECKSCP
jgi:hypothetical protein